MRLPKLLVAAASISSALALQLPQRGYAQTAKATNADAVEFHELMRAALPPAMRSDKALTEIHLLPDASLLSALEASSPQAALKLASTSTLESLAKVTAANKSSASIDVDALLAKEPLTMVIVPGIFGEFIPTRAFEDVLSQPSAFRDEFRQKVRQATKQHDPNSSDVSFDMEINERVDKSLDELVNVGTINDSKGQPVVRVVLLYTPFMSLESMGDLQTHAASFNRRLEKYLAITGPQRLALVGYSRGTVLGLEMLAQAQQNNAAWLKDVKSMISLGGVAFGSVLADDTGNESSVMHDAISAVMELRSSVDPSSVSATAAAWTRFTTKATRLIPRLLIHANGPKSSDLKASPMTAGLDVMSMLRLMKLVFTDLGLNHPVAEFRENVTRFQKFIDAAVGGVSSLTSSSRELWWRTHVLPKNVTYLAITAAMANPERSDFDRQSFDDTFGYSKRSYDDLSLLQNRIDYESLSGLSLNDSQVSVPQAAFLPNAIASLNPANAGLKTEFLGTAGTHHWGLALRVVNAMNDGRTNPYPREALLKALAAKVNLDSQK